VPWWWGQLRAASRGRPELRGAAEVQAEIVTNEGLA
jgi:hypothetical protein